jgi:hypothetical protein
MSARTSNTMTLATGTTTPAIYGNWANGTGTTISGTGDLTFSGRGSQTLTSAGRTFTQPFAISTPGGSVTFDANNYNVTLSNGGGVDSNNSNTRTIAIGSGTWISSAPGTGAWNAATATNLTVTGTGTISLTSASAKSFRGGSLSYAGITLNHGGVGTLTFTGNHTFANISSSVGVATIINFGTSTQTVGEFTASGGAGRVLTIQGTAATNPCTLIYTGVGLATPDTTDYLTLTGVRAYPLVDTWNAGSNTTNNGSLGWTFNEAVVIAGTSTFFLMF